MAGNTAHLSLLSRGVGELKKNGTERVDVFLEPEDYYNYSEHPQKVFHLPPLIPKYNTFIDSARSNPTTNREMHEMYLPKTFMTRKGAMLLFSEDYANKTRSTDYKPHAYGDEKEQDASLHTVTDLTRSILAYGSRRSESEVNLKFVHERDSPRKIRPGFSAKRYLSRLTRSFDDSFLDNLLTKGFVNEKTLFHNNALLPHLRRRINDDLSAFPPPYRILQHMLKAPGALSGYTFYTQLAGDGGLSVVIEESLPSQKQAPIIEIIDAKDGIAKSITYSEMSKEDKGHVLADLLVKSAINQALETQKGVIETTLSRVDEHDGSDHEVPAVSIVDTVSTKSAPQAEGQWGLNMQDAVKSYIESQAASQRSDADSEFSESTPRTYMRGGKAQTHSTKAFEASKGRRLIPPSTNREYVGGVPVASVRSTDSASSQSSSQRGGSIASSYQHSSVPDFPVYEKPPLSPIIDVSMSREASRTFHTLPPVPPIDRTRQQKPAVQTLDGGLGLPALNIQPPTPQTSNLTGAGALPHVVVPPLDIPASITPGDSADEGEGSRSGGISHRSSELQRKKEARRLQKQRSGGRGPIVTGGSQLQSSTESLIQGYLPASQPNSVRSYGSMTGRSLKHSKTSSMSGSRKNLFENDSIRGSVIAAPDGELLKLGDSYQSDQLQKPLETTRDSAEDIQTTDDIQPPTETIETLSQAIEIPTVPTPEITSQQPADSGSMDEDEDDDDWPGQTTARESVPGFSSRAPSVTSKMSGYANTKIRDTPTQDAEAEPIEPELYDNQSEAASQEKSRTVSRATTEQDIIDALSEHAYKIAEQVLSRPHTGSDLAQDAQAAVERFIGARDAQSAEPSVAEYQDLLKDTLATVVSKISGQEEADLRDAEVSPDLVQALANQQIAAEDIEITKDEETGKTVIRAKSSASQKSKQTGSVYSRRSSQRSLVVESPAGEIMEPLESEPTAETTNIEEVKAEQPDETIQPVSDEETDVQGQRKKKPSISKKPASPKESKDLGMDVINYGEDDKPDDVKKEALVRVPPPAERRSSTMKSKETTSVKSGKSGKSAKSMKSGKKEEEREEFIVGKPKETTEVGSIYAPIEEPPKPVEKKPRVPPAKQTPKSKTKKKGGKKGKKEETPADQSVPQPEAEEPMEQAPQEAEVEQEVSREPSPEQSITPSPEPEEETDIDFVIMREEFSDDEPEPERKSVRSFRSFRSMESKESKDTDTSVEDVTDGSDEAKARQISNREARAAKRAAQAAKRREEVEKRRREREEASKREKEELERKEQLARELEEDRRRREADRKMSRERGEEEKRRSEEEERRREMRQKEEKEREKRMKEDYQRKMEEMHHKKLEDEAKRREQEEERRKAEEERLLAEREMMAKMEEEERIAYEKKRAEEEAERLRREEEDRLRREEEARIAMEEARRLAEEMARKQAEYERRLQFNRSLQLESTGLEHTQEITRAFVFSYYELLQWLGLDVPEFEKWKASLKF